MSDAQEQAPAAPDKAPDKAPPAAQQPTESEGRKFVPMDPETQKRFNQLYGYTKQNERVIGEMASQMRAIVENQSRIEQEAEQRGREKALTELKAQQKKALEVADYDAATEAGEKIAELKAEEKAAAKAKPSGRDEPPALPAEAQHAIRNWQVETSQDGNYKRPWAQPGHPKNQRAVAIAAGVFEDPEFVSQGVGACLREVDRLMGLSVAQRPTANVLSDDGGERPRTRAAGLSQDEKLIAHRMYSELPRAKAEEKYREAKQKYGRAS